MIDAVNRVIDEQVFDQQGRRLRAKGVVNLPDLRAPHDQGMPLIGANAVDALAEIDAVEPVTVRLVVLEADERQSANIDRLARAVGLADRQRQVEPATARRLETISVAIVLARD